MKVRNGFSLQYKEKKIELEARKEGLWGTKDLSKWRVDQGNMTISLEELSKDKKLAKKHMLPDVIFLLI